MNALDLAGYMALSYGLAVLGFVVCFVTPYVLVLWLIHAISHRGSFSDARWPFISSLVLGGICLAAIFFEKATFAELFTFSYTGLKPVIYFCLALILYFVVKFRTFPGYQNDELSD